jgi:hypothetical protein
MIQTIISPTLQSVVKEKVAWYVGHYLILI